MNIDRVIPTIEPVTTSILLWRPRICVADAGGASQASLLKLSRGEIFALARFLSYRDLLNLHLVGCHALWAHLTDTVLTASHEPIGRSFAYYLDVIPRDPFLLLAKLPKLRIVHLERIALRTCAWKSSPLALLPQTVVRLELGLFFGVGFKRDSRLRALLDIDFSKCFPQLETLILERTDFYSDPRPEPTWLHTLPATVTSLHLQNICYRLSALSYIQSGSVFAMTFTDAGDPLAPAHFNFPLPSLAYLSLMDRDLSETLPSAQFLPPGLLHFCWLPESGPDDWSLFEHVYPLLPTSGPPPSTNTMSVQLPFGAHTCDWTESIPTRSVTSLTLLEYRPLSVADLYFGKALKTLHVSKPLSSLAIFPKLVRAGVSLKSLVVGELLHISTHEADIRTVLASIDSFGADSLDEAHWSLFPVDGMKSLTIKKSFKMMKPEAITKLPRSLETLDIRSNTVESAHFQLLPRSLLHLSFCVRFSPNVPTVLPPAGALTPPRLDQPSLGSILFGLPPDLQTLTVGNSATFHPQLGRFLPRSLRLFNTFHCVIHIKEPSFFDSLFGTGVEVNESIRVAQSLFPPGCATYIRFQISLKDVRDVPWSESGIFAMDR